MIETFTSNGWRDFYQRYLNVFGFFPTKAGEVLVQITEINDNRCKFSDANGTAYYAVADKGVEFKFIPISKRLFIHEGVLCVAHRVPARQYRRGICVDNTAVRRLNGYGGIELGFDVVNSYLQGPKTVSEQVAAYDTMFGRQGYSLMLYDNQIGTFLDNKTVTLTQPMFKQELSDCFRRNKIEVSIV
jgi:hypothetical protein